MTTYEKKQSRAKTMAFLCWANILIVLTNQVIGIIDSVPIGFAASASLLFGCLGFFSFRAATTDSLIGNCLKTSTYLLGCATLCCFSISGFFMYMLIDGGSSVLYGTIALYIIGFIVYLLLMKSIFAENESIYSIQQGTNPPKVSEIVVEK